MSEVSSAAMERLPEAARNPSIPDMTEVCRIESSSGDQVVFYELQPKQMEAFNKTPLARRTEELRTGDYPKHIGYGGAAGGAKSHSARAIAVTACFKWPGINALIIRRTKGEVKKNHVKPFRQEVPETLRDGTQVYSWNGNDLCASFVNGSDLYFGYMKEEGDELQYQGNEFDVIVFEEATHYSFEQIRYLTGERMRATVPKSFPFAFYPSNPGNQGHQWYKRLFIDGNYDPELNEDPDDYAFVQSHVWDNQILLLRDPEYIENRLLTLPEPLRSWRLYGDWDAGEGLALTMLDRGRHFVDPFTPPSHWRMFGAFDWGYAHPWAFGLYTVSEDGWVYKVFSLSGRRQLPDDICKSIRARLLAHNIATDRIRYIEAGHDCWHQVRARGENAPKIEEVFSKYDLTLRQANIDRIAGLNNLRRWFAWEEMSENGEDITPRLRFMDEPGNRSCFAQLKSLPADPDRPEDALKTDADDYGHGGDDYYDETRYAMASRPAPSPSSYTDTYVLPFDPDTIRHEAEQKRRSQLPRSLRKPSERRSDVVHPEFGEVM